MQAGFYVTYSNLCALNGICRQLGDTWNLLYDRMKNGWTGMYGSIAGSSRPRRIGNIMGCFEFYSRAKHVCLKMKRLLRTVTGGLHRNCTGHIHLYCGYQGVVESGARAWCKGQGQ